MKNVINHIHKWDTLLFCQIFSWNGKRILDSFFYTVSKSGDGPLYAIIILSLILANFSLGIEIAKIAAVAFSIELPVYWLVKNKVKRTRPYETIQGIKFLIIPPDRFSFPSGHTAAAFLMATILISAFPGLFIIPIIWAAAIGFSRIYLGVHYPCDVLAGALLGILSASIGMMVF